MSLETIPDFNNYLLACGSQGKAVTQDLNHFFFFRQINQRKGHSSNKAVQITGCGKCKSS